MTTRTSLGQFSKCELHDPLDRTKNGNCRLCALERNKEYYYRHHEARKAGAVTQNRKQVLKRYGLTLTTYEELLATQGYVCAICKTSNSYVMNGKSRALDIDHDHTTGQVRGALCSNCNRGIGLFKDNPEVLANALEYLTKWKSYTGE
jgi:hypothetical protein